MSEKIPTGQKQDFEIFEPTMLKTLTERAIKTNSESSLNMEPFIDLYGLENVKSDYSEIADKLSGYMEKKLSPSEKMGFIFESAFLDIGVKGHWFGPNSEIKHTSKYDDIKNGVDMVSTILDNEDSAHHLAIASDLTFSKMNSSEKFNRILNNIQAGKLAEIKYFHSELLGFTGKLSNLPRTVIGLDVKNLETFLTNWTREPELTQLQFGLTVLSQIKEQSSGFAHFAKRIHGQDHPVTRTYRRAQNVISEIIDENYNNIQIMDDSILDVITKQSQRLKNEI